MTAKWHRVNRWTWRLDLTDVGEVRVLAALGRWRALWIPRQDDDDGETASVLLGTADTCQSAQLHAVETLRGWFSDALRMLPVERTLGEEAR